MFRKISIVTVLILSNLSAVVFVFGQPDEILMGVITRRSNIDVIPVSVYAEEELMERLLTTAFSAHGAYAVRSAGESDFTFRFSRRGDGMVALSIESGNPSRVLFSETTAGRGWRDAALRAGDLAVQKTLGIPGFFAGLITFVGDRSGSSEIYVSDVFFENVRRLTNDRVDCISPELSPDGKHLLFTSYFLSGFPDIYRINLSTAERTVFAGFRGSNTGAVYSGSGREVALILSGAGNAELYRCNAEGREIRRLTRTEAAVEADPSWSPDGRHIVFTSDRLGKPQLYRVSSEGGRAERLPTNISGVCTEPTWNPIHPNLIAFTMLQGREFKVALFDSSVGGSKVLTKSAGDALESAWTNDGRHIIYTSGKGKRRQLMLMDTTTGKTSRLQGKWERNTYQADFIYPAAGKP